MDILTYQTYEPNPKQKLFHRVKPWNGDLVKAAIGGLSGGKSRCCEEEQIYVCQKTPNGISMALRLSMNRSDFSLMNDYKRLLKGKAEWKAARTCFAFPNGHELIVPPGKDFDRYGSVELVSFYIQEAQEVKYEVFDALTQRLRHPAGLIDGVPFWRGLFDARGVWSSHWINQRFIRAAWDVSTPESEREKAPNPAFVYVRFRSQDNREVMERQRPGYIEAMIRNHPDDERWKRVFIEGETGIAIEGVPVYESFERSSHVAKILSDSSLPILRSVDFGYRHPAVLWGQQHADGRLVLLRELCPKRIKQEDLHSEVEALQAREFPDRHPSSYRDFGDIAGEQENATGLTNIEQWENHFQTSIESRKRLIKDGHEIVRGLLSRYRKWNGTMRPMLMIDESCETLIEAMEGGYCYKEETQDASEMVDKDNPFKDISDALRYLAQIVTEDNYSQTEEYPSGNLEFASY